MRRKSVRVLMRVPKIITCTILLSLIFTLQANGQDSKVKLYVWRFTADKANLDGLADKLTGEFEEALVKSRCFLVLERRDYAALARRAENEKMIGILPELSSQSQTELRIARAQIVVFGKIVHDVESGEFKVTVSFQRFDSTKQSVESIRIKQGVINDAESREQAMKYLVNKICPYKDKDRQAIAGYVPQVKSLAFQLISCRKDGKNAICDFKITNRDTVRSVKFWISQANLFDEFSNKAILRQALLGDAGKKEIEIVSEESIHGQVIFIGINEKASMAKLVRIRIAIGFHQGGGLMEWQNISLDK